jgi:hypothetical protein
VYWAPFLMAGGALLLGIPVYKSQQGRMTAPGEVPPYVRGPHGRDGISAEAPSVSFDGHRPRSR